MSSFWSKSSQAKDDPTSKPGYLYTTSGGVHIYSVAPDAPAPRMGPSSSATTATQGYTASAQQAPTSSYAQQSSAYGQGQTGRVAMSDDEYNYWYHQQQEQPVFGTTQQRPSVRPPRAYGAQSQDPYGTGSQQDQSAYNSGTGSYGYGAAPQQTQPGRVAVPLSSFAGYTDPYAQRASVADSTYSGHSGYVAPSVISYATNEPIEEGEAQETTVQQYDPRGRRGGR